MMDSNGQDSWESTASEMMRRAEYEKAKLEKMAFVGQVQQVKRDMMYANAALSKPYGPGGAAAMEQAAGINLILRTNPNEMPVYQMSLKDLITMWQAKFGETWVDVKDLRGDEFWTKAIDRMGSAKLFEVFGGYYRLMEHA